MITSKQRAYLRGLANDYSVILQIGKGGMTENVVKTVADALKARELIKLHILENSGEEPHALANDLAAAVEADVVSVTGRKAVLYRRSKKKPVIELP